MAQKDPIEIIHPGFLKGEDIAYGADSLTAALDFKQYLIVRFPQRTIPRSMQIYYHRVQLNNQCHQ
jgi:hypothetical protein